MPNYKDKELVQAVWEQVERGVRREMGRGGGLSQTQIKLKMKNAPGTWEDAEEKKEFIKICIKEGVKGLKKLGHKVPKVSPQPQSPHAEPDTLSRANENLMANAGMIWATVDPEVFASARVLLAEVELCREAFWGNSAPPFNFEKLGTVQAQEAAWQWVTERQERDGKEHPESARLVFTLTLDGQGVDLMRLFNLQREVNHPYGSFQLEDDHYRFNRRKADTKAALELLQTALEENEEQISFMRFAFTTDARIVRMRDGEGHSRALKVGPHGELPRLLDRCAAIAKISGWWDVDQTLAFVLTGRPPAPKAGYTVPTGPKFQEFSITATGPLSEEEVLKLYRQVCETARWKPPRFTSTDLALLELHAHTPGASWPERHKTWKVWREKHPDLTDFEKSSRPAAPAMMGIAWARARDKVHGVEAEKLERGATDPLPGGGRKPGEKRKQATSVTTASLPGREDVAPEGMNAVRE